MNAEQRDTWWELVHQCEIQCAGRPYYSSINVASKIRSDAIVAAGALVEMVTPELAGLLEQLAACAYTVAADYEGLPEYQSVAGNARKARELAARIREALDGY